MIQVVDSKTINGYGTVIAYMEARRESEVIKNTMTEIHGQVLGLIGAMALLGFVSSAQAVPIIGGPGLVNPSVDIDFTEIVLADSTVLTTEYESLGVTFGGGWFYNGCAGCIVAVPSGVKPDITSVKNGDISVFNTNLTIAFLSNVSDVSFSTRFTESADQMSSFLNNVLVETLLFGAESQTYGFSGSNFDELRITVPTAFFLDNLKFNTISVPEPATLTLFGLGLLGLGVARLRKNLAA